MREILFRGKRTDNGEWAEGYYVRITDGKVVVHRIYAGCAESDCGDFYPDWYEVVPETVGQFTGKEIGNEKLYVGDIVEWHEDYDDYWGYPATSYGRAIVAYDETNYCYAMKSEDELFPFNDWEWSNCTVIGNIHDNPELMKEV